MHAADEKKPWGLTGEFSEGGHVFHVTKMKEDSSVFVQLMLLAPSRDLLSDRASDPLQTLPKEGFDIIFSSMASLYADYIANSSIERLKDAQNLFSNKERHFDSKCFIESMGHLLLESSQEEPYELYGKALSCLVTMEESKYFTYQSVYFKALYMLNDTICLLGKESEEDEERMMKGIVLGTRDCSPLVNTAIGTVLEHHCDSPERASAGIAALLEQLEKPVIGGFALVDIKEVQRSLK